jgi:lipopolysaccharide export system protein LptC
MNKLPVPLPKAKPTLSRRMHQAWDFALSYLPLFMLSVMLLISVWLVRNAKPLDENRASVPVSHVADYEFTNFTLKSYDINGKIQSALKGTFAEHYQDTHNTLIKNPEVLIYSDKKTTTAKALQAITNEDGSEVQLIGKAQVKQVNTLDQDDTQINSNFLHFYALDDKVVTHVPVTILNGKNSFTSDAMEADNLNQTMKLNGRVKVKIFPHQP